MTVLHMILGLLAAAMAQLLIPPLALLGQAKPPLLLALVLYYALHHDRPVMWGCALFAGMLQDALSPAPPGYAALLFGLAGWSVARFRRVVVTESAATPAFFGAAAAAVVTLATYGLLARNGVASLEPGRLLLRVLGAGVGGMLVTPLVFLLAGAGRALAEGMEERDLVGEIEWDAGE